MGGVIYRKADIDKKVRGGQQRLESLRQPLQAPGQRSLGQRLKNFVREEAKRTGNCNLQVDWKTENGLEGEEKMIHY